MQTSQMRREDAGGRMCFVHVYLLLFLLRMMIGKVESGEVIPRELCSAEDLKMRMNHTAVVIYVFFNGKEIAKSSNISSMEWDKNLHENYKGRLYFTNERDITVTLTNVSYEDRGIYRIVTKSPQGIPRHQDWNITVLVPPIVEENAEKISITEKRVNDSCSNLTCGSFSSLGKPEVNFNWTVSNRKEQTVTICTFDHCECQVVGPATKCLNRTLSAEKCSESNHKRKRRSLNDKSSSSYSGCGGQGTDQMHPGVVAAIVISIIATIAVFSGLFVYKKKIMCAEKQDKRSEKVVENLALHDLIGSEMVSEMTTRNIIHMSTSSDEDCH